MHILEYISLACMLAIGIISSYTDIKVGVVRNRHVLVFFCVALILDGVYYGLFARDIAFVFLLNVLSTIALALVLYLVHDFAGGDFKLVVALSLLYPSSMYLGFGGGQVSLFLTILFAIFFGYMYLLFYSLISLTKGKTKISKEYTANYLKNYLKNYLCATVYVTLINLLFQLMGSFGLKVFAWIALAACMAMAWLSMRIQLLKNKFVIISVVAIDIVLSVYLGVIPISINPRTYLVTAVLLLSQMSIRTCLYEEINSSAVRRGMILSAGSSLLMQNSKVQNLPGISSESLKDRLTDAQVESIRLWSETKDGQKTIVIVRKIPFAVFLLMGYMAYFVIWGIIQ